MKYAVKKILSMLMTLFVVSFCVFLAFSLIPGDPVTSMLGTEATPAKIAAMRAQLGLDRPFFVRYFDWLGHFLIGDMGTSYSYKSSVNSMIADKIPITLIMTLIAFLLMIAISIPLGIYTAKHEGSTVDRIIYALNQMIMSIPPFFGGIMITFIFGKMLHFFKPGGYVSYTKDFGRFLGYIIFPAIAIALPKAAMAVKLLRSSVLDEATKDYVRTAYSRGNGTTAVLYGHVLKNALIPVITFLGMAFVEMMAGSIIIEQVFSIPGLGRILLTSISNRDYPVVEAIIMIIAFLVVVSGFVVDMIYQIIDPRITIE